MEIFHLQYVATCSGSYAGFSQAYYLELYPVCIPNAVVIGTILKCKFSKLSVFVADAQTCVN